MASKIVLVVVTALSAALLPACGGTAPEPPVDGGDAASPGGDGAAPLDASGGPGEVGLLGFCEHYKECGGAYYRSVQACIDASVNYWGSCRRPQLDAFGTCMLEVSCDDWGNPDSYNPAGGPCAAEWAAIGQAPACG